MFLYSFSKVQTLSLSLPCNLPFLPPLNLVLCLRSQLIFSSNDKSFQSDGLLTTSAHVSTPNYVTRAYVCYPLENARNELILAKRVKNALFLDRKSVTTLMRAHGFWNHPYLHFQPSATLLIVTSKPLYNENEIFFIMYRKNLDDDWRCSVCTFKHARRFMERKPFHSKK